MNNGAVCDQYFTAYICAALPDFYFQSEILSFLARQRPRAPKSDSQFSRFEDVLGRLPALFTARVQKRQFLYFQSIIWHQNCIRRPRFPFTSWYFGEQIEFDPVFNDFSLRIRRKKRPYFYFRTNIGHNQPLPKPDPGSTYPWHFWWPVVATHQMPSRSVTAWAR